MTVALPRETVKPTVASGGRRRDGRAAFWFLLPAVAGFLVFYVYPTVRGLWISTTDWTMLSPPSGIGLDNYRELAHDPLFWNALKVTGYYVALSLAVQTVLALGLAALMHRLTRSVALRVTLLLPWLVPNVTTALLWLWLLDGNIGFVNSVLQSLGLSTHGFFSAPGEAMPTIVLVNTWAFTGYTALLYYAGMLQIPQDVYEAAALDGSGEIRTFFRITLPLLRPVLALVLVVSLIGSFQIFDTVAVTTSGGPVHATRVVYYYIYELAFRQFRMGYATAIAITLIAVLSVFTYVQMRLLRASSSDLS
ncbi:carbohydrate ABC transporter permease [Actinocrispum wychmicini]|uniref:Multiple sugar transport system permease protein n=1 Tax=Actinocrispum wychmicini TaxID=1213861 RepID=A0A4R2J5W6_9PSEU|nr:sugar ABC transporter permease [Actinocrispum wychmicini]TCO54323.1 multiple sugar transport system permease protein [Actinocrispum wychmicini]